MAQVRFTADAETDLTRLDRSVAQRVLKRLRWLGENFDNIRPESLTGQWRGVFKLRVGDYRILYTVTDSNQTIIVHLVRHRREVYKSK